MIFLKTIIGKIWYKNRISLPRRRELSGLERNFKTAEAREEPGSFSGRECVRESIQTPGTERAEAELSWR